MTDRFLTRAAAALALVLGCSEPPPSPTAGVIHAHARPPRAAQQTTAARALSGAGPRRRRAANDATTAVLAQGLVSQDYAVRLVATEALGCAPAAVALPHLERQLGDPEEDVRAAAIGALHKQAAHPSAITLLSSVRDDEHEELALRVLAAASLLNPPPSCH